MLKATVSIEVVFKALVDICVQGKETRAIDVLHSRELPQSEIGLVIKFGDLLQYLLTLRQEKQRSPTVCSSRERFVKRQFTALDGTL